jgi:flagellar capping protein FliD
VNSLIDFLGANSDYISDEVLLSINSFVDGQKNELKSFGITLGEGGRLEVDADQLATAVSQDMAGIKETFGGFDGLAVRLSNYASRIATDSPLNYAKEGEKMGMEFADSLYSTSSGMLQNLMQGMLLNTFI